MPYFGASPSSTLASADLNGQALILDADADTTITADTDDQIDIRIAGADDFSFKANTFEVQTGSNIDMNGTELILDANGNTSITADTDDQIDFKIAGADDFRMTANTLSVLSGTTLNIDSGATIANSGTATGFGVALANDGDNRVVTGTGSGGLNGEANLVFDGNKFYVADSANAGLTTGLTINQGAADDQILAFKSSDIAHGITSSVETDTFAEFKKSSSTEGGLNVQGISEGVLGLNLRSYVTSVNTTHSGSGRGSCEVYTAIKSGTSLDAISANANVFIVFGVGGNAKFIVDSDGDIFYDGSAAAFDDYDDAGMLRTFMNEQTPEGVIKTEFDKWVSYNKKSLEECGIIGTVDPDDPDSYHEDGRLSEPLVNLTQLQRFEVGAIVQQRAMFETMKSVVEDMLPGFANKLNERLEAQSLPALPA